MSAMESLYGQDRAETVNAFHLGEGDISQSTELCFKHYGLTCVDCIGKIFGSVFDIILKREAIGFKPFVHLVRRDRFVTVTVYNREVFPFNKIVQMIAELFGIE